MTPEQWAQVREIFDRALNSPLTDRAALVHAAAAEDPAIEREVLSLLSAHTSATDFIEAPAWQVQPDLLLDEEGPGLSGGAIGPYLVRHEIGRGGMGVVYLAEDTRLSRRVALKAVGIGIGADQSHRERLRHEARAAAALSHPGIATVYALEEIEGELYLASEYVPGPTLRSRLSRGPLALNEVVDVALQLARALAIAHAQGVVHRDIKPENVVLGAAGVVKLLDFGIARVENLAGPRLTRTGSTVGTPAYMAPEQIRHGTVDFRTDLFALGLLIYECASGGNPFEAETSTASIARILEIDPPPLSHSSPTGSSSLDHIVSTCLRKNPDERYRSTHALVHDLERVQAELAHPGVSASGPADSRPPGPSEQADPRSRLWWEVHQIIVSIVYALMIYPAWRARIWLPVPWRALFFFGIVAAAVVTVAVRMHLVFTSRAHAGELAAERRRSRLLTLVSDLVFSISLLLAAVTISDSHSEVASLLFSVAIAAGVSAVLIEPSTTRAAFGDQTPRS